MDLRPSAELASVVREDRSDRNAQGLVERKNPVIEQVACGDRHLRVVGLCESDGTENINDNLNVNLAHALESSPEEGVLVKSSPGRDASTCRQRNSELWRSKSLICCSLSRRVFSREASGAKTLLIT